MKILIYIHFEDNTKLWKLHEWEMSVDELKKMVNSPVGLK